MALMARYAADQLGVSPLSARLPQPAAPGTMRANALRKSRKEAFWQ